MVLVCNRERVSSAASYDACCTPLGAAADISGDTLLRSSMTCVSERNDLVGSLFTKGAVPGSTCLSDSETIKPPSIGSKRQTRLTSRCSPPTASHGTQKLYECPSLVLP